MSILIDRIRAERDALRTTVDTLRAKLDASKFCANVADDLRAELALSRAAYESAEDDHTKACAELAAAKETISRYETTAENCDLLRGELAAIKAQEPVAFVHPEQLKVLSAESSATCAVWNKPGATLSYESLAEWRGRVNALAGEIS